MFITAIFMTIMVLTALLWIVRYQKKQNWEHYIEGNKYNNDFDRKINKGE